MIEPINEECRLKYVRDDENYNVELI